MIFVLLAASFSGTAGNKPEFTPEAMAQQAAQNAGGVPVERAIPQEPLAELGVVPGPDLAAEPKDETQGDLVGTDLTDN